MDTDLRIMDTLSRDAFYRFNFDVNTGIVEEDIIAKDGSNYTQLLGLTSPCQFDEMIRQSYTESYLGGVQNTVDGEELLSCELLLRAYEEGKRVVERCIYVPEQKIYHKLSYALIKDDKSGHIMAYVLCRNIADFEKEHIRSLEKYQTAYRETDDIISKAEIGIWHIYLKDGEPPRMSASSKMEELLGIQGGALNEEETYDAWYSRIKDSAIPSVKASVSEMIEKGISENTYAWIHPEKGERFVRCGGTSDKGEDGTTILRGYHMDVTDYVTSDAKQKQLLEDALEEIRERDQNLRDRMNLISSMANIYFCSYYIELATDSYIEIDNSIEENRAIIPRQGRAQEAFERVTENVVEPAFRDAFAPFVDLSTINERLMGKEAVSLQFRGIHVGWAEGVFIAGDRDENGNCNHVIWCIRDINDIKEREESLMYDSYVDQLTGLFNRRMYEDDLSRGLPELNRENCVYVSMDVNGLKRINDELGHEAGDELLVGATSCMRRCMSPYGRVYRTGGDEFSAMIYASKEELEKIKLDFQEALESWHGNLVKQVSVSCGYVSISEKPQMTIMDMARIADKRMYEEKERYYSNQGIDRRSLDAAYKAICSLYEKVLKVDLSEDRIIDVFEKHDKVCWETSTDCFSQAVAEFLEKKNVLEEDEKEFQKRMSIDFIRNSFNTGRSSVSVFYHRRIGEVYVPTVTEMVRADESADGIKSVYLYIKLIED